jgi:tetratricopeptide (TPR) repeat protein
MAQWNGQCQGRRLGDLDEAARCFGHALRLIHEIGDRYYESVALDHLAEAYEAAGRTVEARELLQRAVTILDQLKHDDADRPRERLSAATAGRTVRT